MTGDRGTRGARPSPRLPMPMPLQPSKPRRLLTSRKATVTLLAASLLVLGAASRAGGDQRPAADSLPVDPALATGTLPNGMRYYVRVNKRPAKRALLWLAVNAGSLQEDEDQRGFAHFLEHMAFNGTTHFPRHALLDYLQLAGMRFGADINASTSYDETVYKLEVPTDDGKSLTQGLTMLQDWAGGGMLIDSSEVLAERGVVLGEWRSGVADSLSEQIQDRQDSLLYGADSRYHERSPIGLTKLIKTAQPGPIRRFYHDWYRPDLMAVVAVGDFDPKQMEREIKARFGAIPAAAHPRARVSPRLPSNAEPIVDVYLNRVSPAVTVLWKRPARGATPAAYREALVERLLSEGLGERLRQLSRQPRRPFAWAEVGSAGLPVRGSDAYLLRVVAWPTDSLERGLASAVTELERVAQHGLAGPALDRHKAALLRRLEDAVAQQAVVPSQRYVDAYVGQYLEGGDLMSAPQELALARALVPGITPSDLAEAARFWRAGGDRLTMVTFPEGAHERAPTAAGMNAVFDSVTRLRLAPDSARAVAEAPLLGQRPTPGRIVGEKREAKAGITEWTLSNGARVLFKPSTTNPDELLIHAVSPGGSSLLPDSLFFSPGRMVADMMTQVGGLGTLDRTELEQKISTSALREFQVELTPTEEGVRVGGSPGGLEALFQYLYVQFTAPKLDTAALAMWKQVGRPVQTVDGLTFAQSNQNPRLAPPPVARMAFADTASALAVYRDRFGNASDFTFVIVGAATTQQIRPLVERYLASLPGTGKKEQPADLYVHPLEHIARRFLRLFPVPRASSSLIFDGAFPAAPDAYLTERRRLDALAWSLRLKFTDVLREQMGGTYGVGVQAGTYALPQEHYRLSIDFIAAPERMNGMLDTMFAILDTVRASGATPEELAKIEAMQRRTWENALQDNRYWLNTIELYDRLKIPLDRIVSPASPATAADVRAAAIQYLPKRAYAHRIIMPSDSTSYAASDSGTKAPPKASRLAEAVRHPRP